MREASRQIADELESVTDWSYQAKYEKEARTGDDVQREAGRFLYAARPDEATSLWVRWRDGELRPLPTSEEVASDEAMPDSVWLVHGWATDDRELHYFVERNEDAREQNRMDRALSLFREGYVKMGYRKLFPNTVLAPFFMFVQGQPHPVPRTVAEADNLEIRSDRETVDGVACVVVRTKSPDGTLTAWLDPELGYLPRHAVVEWGPTDRYGGDVLWSRLQSGEDREVTMRAELRWSDFAEVHGAPMAREFDFRSTIDYRRGPDDHYRVTSSRTLSRTPDVEQYPVWVKNIPDGTPGNVFETADGVASPLNYVWEEDRLVKYVDPEKMSTIQKAVGAVGGREATTGWRFWLWTGGALVVGLALLAGAYMLQHRMREESK